MKYYSQYRQDEFLNKNIFKNTKNGFFVEMGADDGISLSNTLFFERKLGWSGICVEPRKEAYEKLVKNRKCRTANVGIALEKGEKDFIDAKSAGLISGLSEYMDPRHLSRLEKEVAKQGEKPQNIKITCITFNELIARFPTDHIDYFSLDVEGGELQILQSIDYKKTPIYCISVENNFKEPDINSFLKTKGYRFVTDIGIDDVYILKGCKFDTYREPVKKTLKRTSWKFKQWAKKMKN